MITKHDFIGEVTLVNDCLYYVNTKRAVGNFLVSEKSVHKSIICEQVMPEKAAAEANSE